MTVKEYRYAGGQIYLDCDESKMDGLRARSQYEPAVTAYMHEHLKPGNTFVDVGAHVGYHTFIAAKIVGEHGSVYAFEPDKNNFGLLHDGIKANPYPNIIASDFIVADKVGMSTFYRGVRSGQGSIKPGGLHNGITKGMETLTIDFLQLGQVDMIKIDVEGAECDVIAGMVETMAANSDIHILVETHVTYGYHPSDIFDIVPKSHHDRLLVWSV